MRTDEVVIPDNFGENISNFIYLRQEVAFFIEQIKRNIRRCLEANAFGFPAHGKFFDGANGGQSRAFYGPFPAHTCAMRTAGCRTFEE